ncbi:hypothetical protein H2198_002494 [Neophaeococcomyces mojaviensis]|uniref:Uncharacterized protein n=1 Tax=Neophaeococcomyces mojaviensis TaxID=3383035 RepID=A0ACC3AEK0_9EURO|nr:hypothetical protein H2198_002494 [Knufia sp. JES_112]
MVTRPRIYITLKHVASCHAHDLHILSHYDSSHSRYDSSANATGDVAQQKSTAVFRFSDLPREIKLMILAFNFDNQAYGEDCTVAFTRFRQPSFTVHPTSDPTRPERSTINVTLPKHFAQLFVSRDFMADALPIFARSMTVWLHGYNLSNFIEIFERTPLLQSIVKGLLAHVQEVRVLFDSLMKEEPNISNFTNCLGTLSLITFKGHLSLIWVKDKEWRFERAVYDKTGVRPSRPWFVLIRVRLWSLVPLLSGLATWRIA